MGKIKRIGHPKECKGRFHDGQNGTWKCFECGMIGGGFNDISQPNKSIEDVVAEFREKLKWKMTLELAEQYEKFLIKKLQQSKEEERERIEKIIKDCIKTECDMHEGTSTICKICEVRETMNMCLRNLHSRIQSLSNTPKP